MSKLLERKALRGVRDFEVQRIDGDGRMWLRLSLPGDTKRALALWSTKPDSADLAGYEEVIVGLQERLAGPAAVAAAQRPVVEFWNTRDPEAVAFFRATANLGRLVEWWPTGWEYWGRGVPEPLKEYLTWQLKYDMEAVPVRG